jgi:ribosomal protein L23
MKKNIIWQSLFLINNISKKIKINKNGQENYIFFVEKFITKEAIKIAIETIFQTKIYNIYFVKHSNKDLLNFNKIVIKLEFNSSLQYPKFLQ